MFGVKKWQEWELVHRSLTYNQAGRERERGGGDEKERHMGQKMKELFKLSCACFFFFTVKTAKTFSLIAPVAANLPSVPDEKLEHCT